MSLPKHKLSYAIQDLLGQNGTEEDYRESVKILNTLLSLNLSGTQVNRIMKDLGPFVDEYYNDYQGLSVEEKEIEGSILAFGNDGKGVPIKKSERESTVNIEEARLMKGKKRGIKKEATVSVSFSFNPRCRDKEEVLRGLFREYDTHNTKKDSNKRFSLNVHKRGFLCNQKKAIKYSVENLMNRNPENNKKIIALVDCGSGLEAGILDTIRSKGLENRLVAIIADVIHVSEYIWKASNAILGEKYTGREKWVRSIMSDLLDSKTEKVIRDLELNIEKTELKESQIKQIKTTIKYLKNHGHKMDYKTYLENGYPISTGVIESTCGHLIKDRMEHSGMRWSMIGAQNMIDLRSVKKNGDWKKFMNFVINKKKPNKLKLCA